MAGKEVLLVDIQIMISNLLNIKITLKYKQQITIIKSKLPKKYAKKTTTKP